MRVLHFAESFSQPTETFIKRYVQKSAQFADIGLVAFNLHSIEDELRDRISFFEITNKVYTRKTIPGASRYIYERLSGMQLWYKQLENAIDSFKPDIIHCHFGIVGVAMMEFNRKIGRKIPYVTSFYGYDISSLPLINRKYRNNLQKLWVDGTSFFAEGPELAKKIVALGGPPAKCLINPLLIPVEDYPVKEIYRNIGDPIKFLFIGRFTEKKGFHLFLEAIGQLRGKINNFSIDIIGSGEYKEKYEQTITANDLQSVVKWHGMAKHDEIINLMKDYDFLVHPSLTAKDNDSEGGAPSIIIEAQAVGLPVITSDHADIPYVMGYHDFIAMENDIPSLIEQIEKMVNSENITHYTKMGMDKAAVQHGLTLSDIYEGNLKKIISSY
ncbi:MAG: glycosyltransferase [Mucilaginibacter sp.]